MGLLGGQQPHSFLGFGRPTGSTQSCVFIFVFHYRKDINPMASNSQTRTAINSR
jgi:hypothetical protein